MDVPSLKSRPPDSHKGDFGRALIIAGSRGMSGAACLSGFSTVKAGAGLVSVAVPESCLATVATYNPCYMTVPIPDDAQGTMCPSQSQFEDLLERCISSDSVGVGPGLGQSKEVRHVVQQLYVKVPTPLVVDADALNALAHADGVSLADAGGPRILTPHVGEFRRLVGRPELSAVECVDVAKALAFENDLVVVLKGHRTLVTDGSQHFQNTTGNPGMATGGSGDVLTGIITALLGQGYAPLEAASLGVHVHGIAGDIAKEVVGHELALSAEDIAKNLGAAFARFASRSGAN